MTAAIATLSGILQAGTLPGIMQLLHHHQHQGWIVLEGTRRGELYYQEGELVHAVCGKVTGEQALRMLLGIEGTFRVFRGSLAQALPRSLAGSHQGLLMQAMRLVDEARQVAEEFLLDDEELGANAAPPVWSIAGLDDLPALEAVPHLTGEARHLVLDAAAARILQAIDGRQTVQELATGLRCPFADVQAVVAQVQRQGGLWLGVAQMPPAFWVEVQAQVTVVLGPASVLLMQDAAQALRLPADQVPRALAPAFLKTVLTLTTPTRRPAVRMALLGLWSRYPEALKDLR